MGPGTSGMALYRLLWRPATLVWIPTAAISSFIPVILVLIVRLALGIVGFPDPRGAILALAFVALIGLLVGQVIRELLHCTWSWAVPSLRRRLLPGVILIGVLVALGPREIWTMLALPFAIGSRHATRDLYLFWRQFPSPPAGVFALYFVSFTAAVCGSTPAIAGLVMGIFFADELTRAAAGHQVLAILVAAGLAPVLLHQTLGAGAARRRPFVPTRSLTGAARAPARNLAPLLPGGGARWKIAHLGAGPLDWLRAGVFENHGYRTAAVRTATMVIAAMGMGYVVLQTVLTAALGPTGAWIAVYAGAGARVWDEVISLQFVSAFCVPLAAFLIAFASISLTRAPFYPLSRQQRAAIELRGSLAESSVVTGLMAALLVVFWGSVYSGSGGYVGFGTAVWERLAGSPTAWVPALIRPLAFVFLTAPVVQLFRLRWLRAPRRRSRVVVFVAVVALTAALTLTGLFVMALTAIWLPRFPLFFEVPMIAALVLLSQFRYRRSVVRYFATEDLA